VLFVGKWNTTVCAVTNLGLVDVDEYSGMAQWAVPSITLDNSFRLPSYGLFVNQLNGCIWLRLMLHDRLFKARTYHGPLSRLLAGGPGGGTVRSLKQAVTLARLW